MPHSVVSHPSNNSTVVYPVVMNSRIGMVCKENRSLIRRPIVHNNELPVFVGLIKNTLNAFPDQVRTIVDGKDYTDQRLIHYSTVRKRMPCNCADLTLNDFKNPVKFPKKIRMMRYHNNRLIGGSALKAVEY